MKPISTTTFNISVREEKGDDDKGSVPAKNLAADQAQVQAQAKTQMQTQAQSTASRTTSINRVQMQPAFILHRYPYRETSLIIEAFTREYGRVSLIAKGAKRPHSALRSALHIFAPLSLSWSGRSELKTLTHAEWMGGITPLAGKAVLSGFYLNELLIRFLAREDPHEKLFQHYFHSMACLAAGDSSSHVLRVFERHLLREVGYGRAFSAHVKSNVGLDNNQLYVFDPDHGWRLPRHGDPKQWPQINGQSVRDIVEDNDHKPQSALQSRALMRFLLSYYLDGQILKTRQILLDLKKLT